MTPNMSPVIPANGFYQQGMPNEFAGRMVRIPFYDNFIVPLELIYLYSVYPKTLTTDQIKSSPLGNFNPDSIDFRPGCGFYKVVIPEAPRDGYVKIPIFNAVYNSMIMTSIEHGDQLHVPQFQSARFIANSVLNIMTGPSAMLIGQNGKPGIGLLPDGVEEFYPGTTDTTPEFNAFINSLRGEQSAMFNSWVQEAEGHYRAGQPEKITDRHYLAAKWLYKDGIQEVPWYKIGHAEYKETKACRGCGKNIMQKATRCEHCSCDLVAWYVDYGMNPEQDDPALVVPYKARMAKLEKDKREQYELMKLQAQITGRNAQVAQQAQQHGQDAPPTPPSPPSKR